MAKERHSKILIVEDSRTQAMELQYILEQQGYEVASVFNGNEALDFLKKEKPSVIISDVIMPGMDGYTLCRAAKSDSCFCDIPVILLTSLSSPEDILRGLECGADDFFTKPYDAQFLLAHVERLVKNLPTQGKRPGEELEVSFGGRRFLIPSEPARILNVLLSIYEITVSQHHSLMQAHDTLRSVNEVLEEKVAQRTADLQAEIIERKKAEEQLFADKERLRVTLQSIGDGVIATDADGRIMLINKVTEELTGWSYGSAVGQELGKIFSTFDEKTGLPKENLLARVFATGRVNEELSNTILKARDGQTRNISSSIAPIRDKEGRIIGIVLVFRDITEQRMAEAQIRHLSFHDKLTGLHNRAFFEEELERLDSPRQLPLSLIVGDVNGLKLANDAFGHQEGDKLLIKIAEILKQECRKEDIIARWGGDEFAVLLPQTDEAAAAGVCERIRKTCEQAQDEIIRPSIALGLATKVTSEQDIQGVVKEAEDRMYRNKLIEGDRTRRTIIASLRKTLGEKTHETEEHALRLQTYALQMGRVLDLTDSQLDELSLLAVLHDIGKIAVPDCILTKPSNLSTDEWDTMKKHSEVGYRIAQTSYELTRIADAILAHHERRDGTGYPQGLKGEQIPLLARIIAIIDAYDVMTHERPYKMLMSHEEAVKELQRCAGTQFDPDLVDVFVKINLKSGNESGDKAGI